NAVSQNSSTPLIVNGVLGESVTLHPKFPAKEMVEAITWLYNGKSIAFIKASGAGSPLIQVTDPKRRERMNFTQSYSLQLSNLTMADTGSYDAQITTETSTLLSTYILKIFSSLHLSTQQTQGPEFTRNVEYSSVSPENTVYAWVTHPNKDREIRTCMKKDDSVTIYSTVNHFKESKPIYPRATALDNVM
ncbi:PREDICTED: SLAM family member 6, partial [Galeopterus variegatus]|uniref:SLAM family member 6 n=1 Tax=Galeopterus variegatus TaxID=482537 RepID=A0ABM0RQN3_GALVR